MKKMDNQFYFQQNKDKLHQETQQSPQEHPERSNPISKHQEFHGDVTIHGQPKCTKGAQNVPRYQK
jgi:hypothetical protein